MFMAIPALCHEALQIGTQVQTFQEFASNVLEALFVHYPEYGHGKSFRNVEAYTPVHMRGC